jgi:hypothetical protein
MPEDKKRDPMPPPDATPEEIGEFWDTHDLADYWDETEEVEFQVNLKSEQSQNQSDETKLNLPSTIADEARPALGIVTDLISESILPAPIRRNALKAFDRLCSALIDVPVGALERRAAEKRAELEARIKIRDEITSQITQQIRVDPEYALRAGHKYAEKIIREQLNLDKISAIAASELKNSELSNPTNPDTSEPDKEQSTDSTNQEANSGEEKIINDDWLNGFETEARQKSTEEMQLRFGRILAGEIEKLGSYSINAVKTLGELNQSAAVLFKRLCSLCVVVEHPCSGVIVDARVVSIEGDASQNALGKYGLGFDQLNVLNEYRLIVSDYNSWHAYRSYRGNENNLQSLLLQHQGRYWDLSPLPDQVEKQDFKLSGVALSRVGRELFRIVDQEPIPEYTEDLKKFLTKQNLSMIEVNSP